MPDLPPNLPEQLAERALDGSGDALRELLVAHLPELHIVLRLNMGAQILARESVTDVAQSLVGDLLPALSQQRFADLAGFRAWLRRAALNKIVDKQRHHTRQRRDVQRHAPVTPSVAEREDLLAAGPLPTPSEAAIDRERAERLERALQRLPEEQRNVVGMKQLCGMSHAEIAEVLGKSEPACRMLLRRGMVQLARELDLLGGA